MNYSVYAASNAHWCNVCPQELRNERYDPIKVRDKNLRQNDQGFTSQDYDALFVKQHGVCAVGSKQQRRHWHIGHDHTIGVVRGLAAQWLQYRPGTSAR
ncbi:MAG TPA: endonuclease domain-containing protein [Ktedonobacteraceae bacterium]